MEELNFYIKKLQDLEFRGEWKEGYKHNFEKIYELIEGSRFLKRAEYIKELEDLNHKILDLPYIATDEDKLNFRRTQKHMIDLCYKVMTENKKIYLVHGKDSSLAEKVSSFLGRLHLEFDMADETQDTPAIKKFIKRAKKCDYAIVLFSADELIYPENSHGRFRASQNVLLELGYFLSNVGKKNVLIFHRTDREAEQPYLLDDLNLQPFDANWRQTLVEQLQKAGIYIEQKVVKEVLNVS